MLGANIVRNPGIQLKANRVHKKGKVMSNEKTSKPTEQESVWAVYDSASGDILHIHQCITAAGRTPPNARELEETALRYATEAGHNYASATLAAAQVNSASLQSDRPYKIDISSKALVEKS
jgi:hypothetical protein